MFAIASSEKPPEIPSHLSSDAKDFVTLCFQRDPQKRPTATELLQHPFVKDIKEAPKVARACASSMFFSQVAPVGKDLKLGKEDKGKGR